MAEIDVLQVTRDAVADGSLGEQDVEAILAANELTESSELELGRMLLIPRGR